MLYRILKYYKKKPQFYSWIATYLFVILISVIITFIMYFSYSNVLTKEIEKSTDSFLQHMRELTESRLNSIESMTYNLINSSSINNVINYKSSNFTEEKLGEWTKNAIKDTKNGVNNDFIKNSLVAFKSTDIVVDMSGKYSKKMAYDIMFENYFENFDEWTKYIFSPHICEYKIFEGKNGEKIVIYIQTFPIARTQEPLAVNIVMLDISAMGRFIDENKGNKDALVSVFDEDGTEIIGNGSNYLPNNSEDIINNDKYTVLQADGKTNGWKYLYVVPRESYMQTVWNIRLTTLLIYIVSIIIGICFAVYFSMYNYRNVREVISKLPQNIQDGKNDVSEFTYINRAITQILDDSKTANEELGKASNTLQKIFINRLFKRRINKNELIAEFEKHNIAQGTCYMVVMFNIVNFGIIEEDYVMAHFLITNVFEEVMADSTHCYFSETDDMYACLITFANPDKTVDFTKNNVQTVIDILNKHLQMEIVCAISEPTQLKEDIPYIYEQALKIISYSFLKNDRSILLYSDIMKPTSLLYNYNMETEKKILNSILAGDYGSAKEVLQEIFDENFRSSELDLNMAKMLIYEIGNTIIKAVHESSEVRNIGIDNELLLSDNMFKKGRIKDIENQFSQIIYQLCIETQNIVQRKSDSRKKQILNVIHTQYQDNNLSVGRIADELGISITYISQYFKQQTGIGILDYITKYRIEKAKALLASNDNELKISDIGEMTGFYNTNIFIRSFKKCEGITPGQYRLRFQKGSNE